MKKLFIALALVAAPAFTGAAFAAEPEGRPAPTAEEQARWEQHRAAREAAMTPEQKARHAARKAEWDAMTPEQREAKKAERKQRHGNRKGRKGE